MLMNLHKERNGEMCVNLLLYDILTFSNQWKPRDYGPIINEFVIHKQLIPARFDTQSN
jgi:hypothetical protein